MYTSIRRTLLPENFKTQLSTEPEFHSSKVLNFLWLQNMALLQTHVLCILLVYPFPPVDIVTIILKLLLQNCRDFYSYCSFFHSLFCVQLWSLLLQYHNSILTTWNRVYTQRRTNISTAYNETNQLILDIYTSNDVTGSNEKYIKGQKLTCFRALMTLQMLISFLPNLTLPAGFMLTLYSGKQKMLNSWYTPFKNQSAL